MMGGKFLQCGPWLDSGTYDDLSNAYIKYAKSHYNVNSHFVMDGYDDENSTKVAEQARRIKGNIARDIVFTGQTELSGFTKTEFLNDRKNEQKFAKLLSARLRMEGYEVTECIGEADYEIAEVAITLAEARDELVNLDAADTDILVMHSTERYRITRIKSKLRRNVIDHIAVPQPIS